MTSEYRDGGVTIRGLPALVALHKALLEAKLHPEPENTDVAGSPHVAELANAVVEAIIDIDSAKRMEWRAWRELSRNPWVKERVVGYAASNPRWHRLSGESKESFMRCAIAPFSCTADELERLVGEADRQNDPAD